MSPEATRPGNRTLVVALKGHELCVFPDCGVFMSVWHVSQRPAPLKVSYIDPKLFSGRDYTIERAIEFGKREVVISKLYFLSCPILHVVRML